MIKLHDGGPAFYRRRVIGLNGEFDAFKLRSMRVDADEVLRSDREMRQKFEVNYKLENDPRVTRIGALLRKTNFDELPQLWNVFRGQMSLVGPRMITSPELEKYGSAAWIFQSVRPGLTGYWQIHGRNSVTYQRRVEMDLFYVKNWSILLDIKLLLQTSLKTFQGSLG
jgi:lipopolysaccharide/colanic/teichoic acid biosynthesis glycosyltransferase